MTDIEEHPPLSVQDIALLKEIVRWRRNNGVEFYLTTKGKGFAGPYGYLRWKRWTDATDGLRGRMRSSVVVEREWPEKIGEEGPGRYVTLSWHRAKSVTQAVDLLVAYGHLPARFSSAYRAGWDGRGEATDTDGCVDLFTWPELAPAVEPTW